ncbi:MAG TPA: hypothetical protein VMV09_10640 [Candidatus Saccharimonadales bacterium]|nr:hypothetical protein [Candidatus Saccharimonadales bacterium]
MGLPDPTRGRLLLGIWTATALGVVFRCTWPGAPRALYTLLYVGLGWSLLPVARWELEEHVRILLLDHELHPSYHLCVLISV